MAISAAAPSGLYASPWHAPAPILTTSHIVKPATYGLAEYQVPAIAKVGAVVSHVPSSVSHQSSSVVHSHGAIVTPVVTPVHKTIIAPAPILKTAWPGPIAHAPLAYNSLSAHSLWGEPILSAW